jgi:hypothetical protein
VQELVRECDARIDEEISEYGLSSALPFLRLRAALETVDATVGRGTSGFSEIAALLRDSGGFDLPIEVRRAHRLAWFTATAAAEGWRPGSRIAAKAVWEAYEATEDARYGKHAFLADLDAVLGARVRDAYRVPPRRALAATGDAA